jgi:hypothetical protein
MVKHRSLSPPATSPSWGTSEGVERMEKTVDRHSVCPASLDHDHQLVAIGELLGQGQALDGGIELLRGRVGEDLVDRVEP